ncbi:hypothetical protein FN846DRAFT_888787 [Sphaerosporella brunnea]|uniref:WSC domain-containing protein n=1 Tax=Sphaerosporella brunnea TaxID=1250544 RepID=A0A5J5F111_9PEZI|nr:hypothetical protein FN846DRAFT_888787 [Sphaerosporella brunnea]
MRSWATVAFAALALSSWVTPVAARDMQYCSSSNTGDGVNYMSSLYQSDGLCYDHCGDYAFAVVQGSGCWCSNYAPGATTDTGDCNEACPGYPTDTCGNTSNKLYGYMAIVGNQPSGTKDASTVSTTSIKPKTSTVTEPGPTTTLIITATKTSATTSSPATTLTTSTTTGKTTTTPGVTVIQTVGGYTTIIVVPTGASASAAAETSGAKGGAFFDNAGRTAGVVIGIILGLCLIIGALFFIIRRRNQNRASMYDESGSGTIPAGGAGVFGRTRTRSMSTLGLVGEKGQQSPTSNGHATAGPHTANGTPPATAYDQRLDPGTLFMRFDHQTGSSRMSVRSLRDDTDYSRRVLRVGVHTNF